MRLASMTAIWAVSMVAVTLVLAWAMFSYQLWQGIERAESKRVINVASAVAQWPAVIDGVAKPRPYAPNSALQHRIEALRKTAGLDFIVVMNAGAIRLTHPIPERINRHFRGDDEHAALAGATYSSIALGTLGRSVRGFSPVVDDAGRVVGAVSVGVRLTILAPLYASSRATLLGGLLLIACIGIAGAWGLARRIKAQLRAMEPADIAALAAEHQAVLDSLQEGVIVIGMDQRLRLINPAARRLLAASSQPMPELGDRLANPLLGDDDDTGVDRPLVIAGRSFRGNLRMIGPINAPSGAVLSFRDTEELERLGEELTGVRRYADALRADRHETNNQWHAVLGLAELGDTDAIKQFVAELTEVRAAAIYHIAGDIADPVLGGFLMAKQAEAREAGVVLAVEVERRIPLATASRDVHAAIAVLGNLIDNALEALALADDTCDARVDLSLTWEADRLMMSVSDNGPGMTDTQLESAVTLGFSTRGDDRGLGLALITQRLAEAGEDLKIYSTPGVGTLVEAGLVFRAAL